MGDSDRANGELLRQVSRLDSLSKRLRAIDSAARSCKVGLDRPPGPTYKHGVAVPVRVMSLALEAINESEIDELPDRAAAGYSTLRRWLGRWLDHSGLHRIVGDDGETNLAEARGSLEETRREFLGIVRSISKGCIRTGQDPPSGDDFPRYRADAERLDIAPALPFDEALARYPELRERYESGGPGLGAIPRATPDDLRQLEAAREDLQAGYEAIEDKIGALRAQVRAEANGKEVEAQDAPKPVNGAEGRAVGIPPNWEPAICSQNDVIAYRYPRKDPNNVKRGGLLRKWVESGYLKAYIKKGSSYHVWFNTPEKTKGLIDFVAGGKSRNHPQTGP